MKDYLVLSLTLLLSMHLAFSMEDNLDISSMEKDTSIEESLFTAIMENNFQEVSDLLTQDYSLAKACNSAGNSALIAALSRGSRKDCQSRNQEQQNNLVIIKLLLLSGADPNEGPAQFKAFDYAMEFNSDRHRKLLKKYGALPASEMSPVEQEKKKLREHIKLLEPKKKTIE